MREQDEKILEMVRIRKTLAVDEICYEVGVSERTVRRALERLAGRGLVVRYRGGCRINDFSTHGASVLSRMQMRPEQKERIARAAAELIAPGSAVILMGGSTVYRMCKYLRLKRMTVLTNSMMVFEELKNDPLKEIIILGGRYDSDEMEMRGAITSMGLRLLRADSLFMSTTAFSPESGFLTDSIEFLEMYDACINAAQNRYVLADSSKLGAHGVAVIAENSCVHCLISDSGLADSTCGAYEKIGVRVICV